MKVMTDTPRCNFQDEFVCDLYQFTVTPTLYEVQIFFFKQKHSSYKTGRPHVRNGQATSL